MKWLFVAAALVAPSLAADPILTFTCGTMKEVCSNMCYGARCLKIGDLLTNDAASTADKRVRRKAAGCLATGGNRCSVKQSGVSGKQCDEYPFASTVTRGTEKRRMNRCVPATENSKQGGSLSAFYKSKCTAGKACNFQIAFSGTSKIQNCDATLKPDCNGAGIVFGPGATSVGSETADDGSDNDEILKRNETSSSGTFGRYLTGSGMEISVPGGAVIGQAVYWVEPKNETMWNLQALDRELNARDFEEEEDTYEDMVENSILREDVVVQEIF